MYYHYHESEHDYDHNNYNDIDDGDDDDDDDDDDNDDGLKIMAWLPIRKRQNAWKSVLDKSFPASKNVPFRCIWMVGSWSKLKRNVSWD